MHRLSWLGLLASVCTTGTAAPWLVRQDGSPWPHRVVLTTTGAGPVMADVSALGGRSFALLAGRPTLLSGERVPAGAPGAPVPFAVVDRNGDGLGDVLEFVSEYQGAYLLYFGPEAGPTSGGAAGLRIEEASAGSWLPLRTNSPGPEANLEAARAVLDGLRLQGPMVVIQGPHYELWIGRHNGLIERARPRSFRWSGSCFREWASNLPNLPDIGEVQVVAQSPVRVDLRWQGRAQRDMQIWVDGTVFSSGDAVWAKPQLIASACPYPLARTEGEVEARHFSELLSQRRALPHAAAFALWGRNGEALTCRVLHAKLATQEVWLDGGELAHALAMETGAQAPDPQWLLDQVGTLWRTVVSGAMWVFELEPEEGQAGFRLDYCFGQSTPEPMPHVGMQRAEVGPVEEPPAQVTRAGEALPPTAEIRVRPLTERVPRLVPNRGVGWEGKAFGRALDNPLPAFFQVTVTNPSERAAEVVASVEAAPWLERVELIAQESATSGGQLAEAPRFSRQLVRRQKARYPFRLPLAAKQGATFTLALKATEESVGECTTFLQVVALQVATRLPISFVVEPSVPLIGDRGIGRLGASIARALGCNMVMAPSVLAHADASQWVTETGDLTALGRETLEQERASALVESAGLFHMERLGLEGLLGNMSEWDADPVRAALARLPGPELTGFLARFLGHYRPWERWNAGWLGLEGTGAATDAGSRLAALYEGFRAGATKPLLHLFSVEQVAAGLAARAPCDIPGIACPADDAAVHGAVDALLAAGARGQHWVALSARPHETDYTRMRRQAWWCWYRGVTDGGLMWLTALPADATDAERALCAAVLPTTDDGMGILTDRALAMIDVGEDMACLAHLRLAKARAASDADRAALERLRQAEELEAVALRLSQEGHFAAAREAIQRATKAL